MSLLLRIKSLEKHSQNSSGEMWHVYTPEYLERLQKYIPPEDFIRIKKEGGYWLPRSDPLHEINFSEELHKRENARKY